MSLQAILNNQKFRAENPPAAAPVASAVAPPAPQPCTACGSLSLWLDAYGHWRCLRCCQPPAESLIRRLGSLDPRDREYYCGGSDQPPDENNLSEADFVAVKICDGISWVLRGSRLGRPCNCMECFARGAAALYAILDLGPGGVQAGGRAIDPRQTPPAGSARPSAIAASRAAGVRPAASAPALAGPTPD